MSKRIIAGSFLLSILIISCQKNISEKLDNKSVILKDKVIAFIDAKKAKVGDAAKATIENLKTNIDWTDFSTSVSPAYNQKQTAFRIKKENTTASRVSTNTYTALYVTQNSSGNVVHVNTLEIDIPNNNNGNLNSLALNLVNNDLQGYTGALVKRNLSGYYIYEIDINNGTPSAYKYMKKRNPGGRGQLTGRTESCVDWYLQTYVNGILISEVFLFTDCGLYVEEGGGGGGGGNGNPPPNASADPCAKADSLGNATVFKTLMAGLHTSTDSSFEFGYFLTPNPPFTSMGITPVQGANGNHFLPDFSLNNPIYGILHSHFAGGMSIFSPADLRALYMIYKEGNAAPGFTYAVTTQTGSYVLDVNDVQAFLLYGDAHLQDNASFNDFQWGTYASNYISESGSHDGNEAGFLRMIANGNMGLKLLSSDGNGFDDWKVKGLNTYGSSINLPC